MSERPKERPEGAPDRSPLAKKASIRFAKTGPAAFHSHHDMIRFWERALRRSGLPLRLTQGFNPHPRIVFPHALGLGVASRCEEVEIELCRETGNDEIRSRLDAACAGVVEILAVTELPPAKKGRIVVRTRYEITGWSGEALATLETAAKEIMARERIAVERGKPGERREVDIRPFIETLGVDRAAGVVKTTFHHSQAGSARTDEVAGLLAAAVGMDWHDLTIVKTAMELA